MKKLRILLIFLMFFMCKSVYAIDKEAKVHDYAQVLTDTEEEKLNEFAKQYVDKNNIDMIIVTARHKEDTNTLEYAEKFYSTYEFGIGEDKSGIILALDFNEDNTNLEMLAFGSSKNIYDDITEYIEKEIKSEQNYYEMLKKFINLADKYTSKDKSKIIGKSNVLLDINYLYIMLISSGISSIVVFILYLKSRAKKEEKVVCTYLKEGSLVINNTSDKFVTTHTASTRLQDNKNKNKKKVKKKDN